MGSLLDLIHGHRAPPPSVAREAATSNLAIFATQRRTRANDSNDSNFRRGTPSAPPPIPVTPGAQDAQVPRRLWLVQTGSRTWISASFTPPQTLSQVRDWHPDALEISQEEETSPHSEPVSST